LWINAQNPTIHDNLGDLTRVVPGERIRAGVLRLLWNVVEEEARSTVTVCGNRAAF